MGKMTLSRTKLIVANGLLVAIMLILGFTPIGYIKIGVVEITLMCLPVMIGTLILGLKSGIFLSAIFIGTSIYQAFITPSVLALALNPWPVPLILCITLPRLVIPLTTYFTYQGLSKKWPGRQMIALVIASVVGSLTNTVLFLGAIGLAFTDALAGVFAVAPSGVFAALASVALVNGVPEAIVAGPVCGPVAKAVKQVWKQ